MKLRMMVVLSLFTLTGCAEGLIDEMARFNQDPETVSPRVESFREELTLTVSWDDDVAADEYILRRGCAGAQPFYRIVYRGTGTDYRDTALQNEELYLYTLSKRKGEREFGPSLPALGVGNVTIDDTSEPNDLKEQATILLYEIVANTYYYQDRSGTVVQDCDWYSIEVPPRHIAKVIIEQIYPDPGGAEFTALYFQREGETRFSFADQVPIDIQNSSMRSQSIRFQISPIPAECYADPHLEGGTVIQYTLTVAAYELQ